MWTEPKGNAIITDMSKTRFHIIYDGPALENHQMEVRDLAPALLALGDLLDEANAIFNENRSKLALNVRASFRAGSFGIDLDTIQSLATQARTLFGTLSVLSAKDILETLGLIDGSVGGAAIVGGSLIWFLKKLRGRKITSAVILDNGKVKITVDKEEFIVEQRVIDLYRNWRIRKSLEDMLRPLEKEGIDKFAATDNAEAMHFVEVTKEEYHYFIAPTREDELIDDREEVVNLQLVNIAFRDDNKWRFSDGGSTFYAAIMDDDFLNRIQMNELSFSKGDILKVRLRRRQWLTGEEMKTDSEVLEVLEHRRAASQLRLPIQDGRTDTSD